ncbi:cardiolipin synthase [Pasteurellaceae bacterium LIM206]|nr:cardiolipin synthase [Pasteurellaceae bacterium LIM206]
MAIDKIIAYLVPFLMWALVVSITLRQITKKQSAAAMVSWLMVIYLVPVVGIIAYLIFGEVNLGKRRAAAFARMYPKYTAWFSQLKEEKLLINRNISPLSRPLFDLTNNRLDIPSVRGNELHILDTPAGIMHNIIRDINRAQTSINMVFYIWNNGGLVDEVMNALLKAKERGVNIHILLDSVGSRSFLKSVQCRSMRAHGIKIEEALHVNLFRVFLRRIDLRQHRKIIVIDNNISYTGSMNMVDPKFFKTTSDGGEWIDIMVRIDGPVSAVLNGVHAWDWEVETRQQIPPIPLPTLPVLPSRHNSHSVQILPTGPGFPDDLMEQAVETAIFSARQSISITSPYFVPTENIAAALRTAALRGVDVTLIIPLNNDSLMVRWASRTFFDDLLAAGVKICDFQQGLLHTKSILIDNKLALVGTVNMDVRSFSLNFEVTMIVEDDAFADEINLLHENYLQGAKPLQYEQWIQRPMYKRIIEKLFFLFSPLL